MHFKTDSSYLRKQVSRNQIKILDSSLRWNDAGNNVYIIRSDSEIDSNHFVTSVRFVAIIFQCSCSFTAPGPA